MGFYSMQNISVKLIWKMLVSDCRQPLYVGSIILFSFPVTVNIHHSPGPLLSFTLLSLSRFFLPEYWHLQAWSSSTSLSSSTHLFSHFYFFSSLTLEYSWPSWTFVIEHIWWDFCVISPSLLVLGPQFVNMNRSAPYSSDYHLVVAPVTSPTLNFLPLNLVVIRLLLSRPWMPVRADLVAGFPPHHAPPLLTGALPPGFPHVSVL